MNQTSGASTACLDPRRKSCLCTASNLGDALASLGYNSQKAYAERLLKKKDPVKLNDFMARGLVLESYVADSYACFFNVDIEMAGFDTYDDDPRFGASGDYFATDPVTGERINVEIKTTQKAQFGRGYIPVHHLLQMLGQMVCFGLRRSHYVAYHTERQVFYMAEVTFDDTLWSNVIYPRLKAFMDMVQRGGPVPGRVTAATKLTVSNAVYNAVHISDPFSSSKSKSN